VNSKYFGDSYDLAKRFFIKVLKSEGYAVYADPIFTDDDAEMKRKYYSLIGAKPIDGPRSKMTALFVDPDTGIGKKVTKKQKHVTIQELADRLKRGKYTLIMVFDQSFRRVKKNSFPHKQMQKKLSDFSRQDVFGFFFKSHANFFFGSLDKNLVEKYRCKLLHLGIPSNRFYPTKKHKKRDCSRSL
jgi:hypothetical protein